MASSLMNNKKFYRFVFVPTIIIIASILRAVIVEIFVLPFDFAPGGVTGIGTMIEYKTGFSSGWTILIINVPLIILAFLFLSRDFAIRSTLEVTLSSVLMWVLGEYANIPQLVDEPVLSALAAGVIGGVSLNMMLKIGGSNGGTDVIGSFIQRKYKATNVAWFISALDGSIVLISFFVYDKGLTPILLSLTETVTLSLTSNAISTGFKTSLKYEIITKDPEPISQEIIRKLGRGVTKVSATGMYSHNESAILICVIRKRQLAEFNEILKKYPDTFAYVVSTSEVVGRGFSALTDSDAALNSVMAKIRKNKEQKAERAQEPIVAEEAQEPINSEEAQEPINAEGVQEPIASEEVGARDENSEE